MMYSFDILLLCATVNAATTQEHTHRHMAKRGDSSGNTTCAFPSYEGMVAVQTDGANAGWAMHEDQQCTAGSWCPYACKPGQLMGQWDPSVTSYTYPGSQYGGMYCNDDCTLQKPISSQSYCYDGKGTVSAVNNANGGDIAFCQTVLPGNEEMLIPTLVSQGGEQTLAVPGTDYWASTASHFYINPPGVSCSDGCKWGTSSNPWGNWSPYVAGANMDDNGNTFVKIGWNPIYLESFGTTKPSFGIKITCDDPSQCNGLECYIDPAEQDINNVFSSDSSTGAGGGNFCVVTARNNAKAKIVIFDAGDSSATGSTTGVGGSTSSSLAKRGFMDTYASTRTVTTTTTTFVNDSNIKTEYVTVTVTI